MRSKIGDRRKNKAIVRAEKVREHGRYAFLKATVSIAVLILELLCSEVESKSTIRAKNLLAPFSRGVSELWVEKFGR